MPRVSYFEINADEPERAIQFYSSVFGWKIEKWNGPLEYWLVTTGKESEPGIDGGIQRRTNPQLTTVNSIEVRSLDEMLIKITSSGGKIIEPTVLVPGVGYYAICSDSEGNPFGVVQRKYDVD